MRDETVYQLVQTLERKFAQYIGQLEQSIRLAFTGQEIRGASLQALLLKKGLITEEEFTAQVGETIQKMQADAEEASKKAAEAAQAPQIIVPTTEQVQQVTTEEPVVPPQA